MSNNIEVSILGESKGDRHRLKVSVHDIGIHIMGMVIQKSKLDNVDWFVTTPAHLVNSKYYKDITFDTTKPLWEEIERACIREFEGYLNLPK